MQKSFGYIQVYLSDIMDSVPDRHNKANHNFSGFPMHSKIMLTLYCSLLSVQ